MTASQGRAGKLSLVGDDVDGDIGPETLNAVGGIMWEWPQPSHATDVFQPRMGARATVGGACPILRLREQISGGR